MSNSSEEVRARQNAETLRMLAAIDAAEQLEAAHTEWTPPGTGVLPSSSGGSLPHRRVQPDGDSQTGRPLPVVDLQPAP